MPTVRRRTVLAGAAGVAASTVAPDVPAPAQATAPAHPLMGGPAARLAACPTPTAKLPMPVTRYPNVLVTGDAGSGTATQAAVAAAARKLGETVPIHIAVGLGDNVYEFGVTGTCDDDFKTKFEQPNAGIDVPWLMVQGNHDNSSFLIPGDGGDLTRGDHEVAYHQYSAKWYMPARYYSATIRTPMTTPLAQFIVLDENPVTSYVPQLNPYWWPRGPFMTAQREWLRSQLATSNARWKFVLAHHPYKNNGKHGEAGSYDGITFLDPASGRYFKELIEQDVLGKADYLLAGHDHSLQHLELGPEMKGTGMIVSGAAGKVSGASATTRPNQAHWENYDKAGFFLLQPRAEKLVIKAYTVNVATATATLAHSRTIAR